MATIGECPSCQNKLRVPDELHGQPVRCPVCATVFQPNGEPGRGDQFSGTPPPLGTDSVPPDSFTSAPHASAPTPREDRYESDRDDDNEDYRRPSRRRRSLYREAHRGTMIMVLGIISVVLAPIGFIVFPIVMEPVALTLGIIAWAMGARDLRKIGQGIMDPEGEGQTRTGFICGIIGTCIASLGIVCAVIAVIFYIAIFTAAMSNP